MVCAFLKCGNLKISQIHTEGLFFYIEFFTLKYYSAKEIATYLKELGVTQNKIVWHSVRVDHRRFDEVFCESITK